MKMNSKDDKWINILKDYGIFWIISVLIFFNVLNLIIVKFYLII